MDRSPSTLIFDGDCAFCTSCANFAAERLDRSIAVEPWQRLNLAAFGLTEADVTTAVYWVDASGTYRGHLGVARCCRAMGKLWPVLGRLIEFPLIRPIAGVMYRVIATNRHKMPGGTAACRLDPTDQSGTK